jgi:hypothetical protein
MNIRYLISYLLMTFLLVLVQILFLKNLALFGVAFAFIYLLAILSLPLSIKPFPLLIISFLIGLSVDVFYETMGMHAAAVTLLAFLRPFWLKAISPSGGYDDTTEPTLTEMGLRWFISYSFPLVLAYSLLFFLAEQWGSGGFFGLFNKTLFSSIFTVVLAILVQILFFKRRRGI